MTNINKEILDVLGDLTQLDINAAEAYSQALSQIDDNEIYNQIAEFRNDHQRHVKELTTMIIHLGGEPLKKTKDLTGFIIKGFTAVRSLTGTVGALKAMQTNERMTNENYQKALQHDLPSEVASLVEKNLNDEKRHLEYVNLTLEKINS